MKVIMMVYIKKKIVQDKWAILLPKMAHPHNSGFALIFFKWKGLINSYTKVLLVVFWEKNSFDVIWSFQSCGHFLLFDCPWSNWAMPLLIGSLNSQEMISLIITTGSWNSQGMICILKQWRHNFSGKHLCDQYFVGIM